MKSRIAILAVAGALLFGFTQEASAQADTNTDAHTVQINIPEVALLDIEPGGSTSITLAPTAPTEAGEALDFSGANDNSLWLNYSSIVGSTTEPSRKVTAAITTGTVPSGMLVKVTAGADAGGGAGTVGTPAGELTLSSTAQDLITGVGSCYTGNGDGAGHNLTYALALDPTAGSYANIDFDEATTLTITYTLTDN